MSLEIADLKKSYLQPGGTRLPILDVPRFSMAQGEQVVLLGSSGGGKTTLLNVIAGISEADSGSVRVAGHDIVQLGEEQRDRFRAERIGYVFQTFNLLAEFTALENVLLGMSFGGVRPSRPRAVELLEQVGLGHRLHHRPSQLSVGEQQRVSVVRALVKTPRLLLADEPTANVDPANQQSVIDLIRSACTSHEVSLLLVTHAPEVARQFDRVEQLKAFNRAAGGGLADTN